MVYINHIYANVTASDDSQANVYAMVVPSDTNTADVSIINYIVANVATNAESSGVYRLTQDGLDGGMGIPFGQLDTVVQKNLFKQYVSPDGVSRILKGIDYKVCFLAIDEYANRSDLEVSVSGNIVDRPAPVHTAAPSSNVNVLTNTGLSNITTSLNMSSDMYFEYYAAMFGSLPSDAEFTSFITNNSSNPHVAYGNVTSANSAPLYDALLVKPLLNASTVFTRAFTNIMDATLYELAADKSSDRYLGVFMRNMDPYGEHVATRVEFTHIPTSVTSTFTLTLVTTTVFDRSANVAFNLNTPPSENETIYYKTFNSVQTVNGTFIDDLFANPQDSFSPQTGTDVKRILQFWNGSGYENMVFGNIYHVYARVRHNQTGQMSTSYVSFQTGAEPLLLQGIIAQTRTSASTVDFTNTVVVDQSNVDIYIGVTSNAYDDSNVIKHLTNNLALDDTTDNYNQTNVPKDGVLKFSAQVPNTYGLFTLSTSVIDKYYTNIVDNTTSLITGAGGQNVYMYVVDENQLGNVFSTVLANIAGYSANEITAELIMDEIFDRSFLVKTPYANINAVHYIMAFSNIQEPPVDFWTETSIYTKFVGNANVSINGINAVSIIDYFDPTIDTRNTIIPGGTYNIYTVALDTINNETYHDSAISILRDVVAVQPPVISSFTVDFNT